MITLTEREIIAPFRLSDDFLNQTARRQYLEARFFFFHDSSIFEGVGSLPSRDRYTTIRDKPVIGRRAVFFRIQASTRGTNKKRIERREAKSRKRKAMTARPRIEDP